MEVKINVDETMFKDILEKELKAFSQEELHDIIREAIIEGMKSNDTVKNLFLTKDSYYSGYKPSQVMIEAARNIDLSPAYKEIQDKIITELKENHSKLVENVMLQAVINGISNSWDFQNTVANAVEMIIRNRNSN